MHRKRLLRRAAEAFRERYGALATGIGFAPGRVNLIGEHVDYCELPVLPFALSHGIAIAFRPRSDRVIRCANRNPAFAEIRFTPGESVDGWGRYLAAAGSVEKIDRGFDGMVVSNLPIASGLSSSSSLVVAAALALLWVNRQAVPFPKLALLVAAAEQGVAIAGGAMDQSVALGAQAGHALWIDFHEPGWRQIPVDPDRFGFLAAFSGEVAEKGGPLGQVFDQRVQEAHTAIARLRETPPDDGGFGPDYPAPFAATSGKTLLRAARHLPSPLDRRFRHLVTEAERTRNAARALEEGDAATLGRLLNEAHDSLRDDFEVSTAGLDDLVEQARKAGALGARLTGAGFGGSIVILAEPRALPGIREQLMESFYRPRGLSPEAALLDATPAGGAKVFPIPDRASDPESGSP